VRNIEGVRGLHIMAVSWPAAVPQVCQMLGLYPRPVV
jgi:methylenetetrahydrofolate reductase (NADPH)